MRLAFEASGQSASKANSLLARIPKLMNDIALNVGDASKAAKALGFSLVDSSGNAKSADRVFRELTEILGHIEDKTQKAQIAFMLFGRQGAALLQSLGDQKNLEKFIDLANKFGVDVGPAASKAAADLQLQMAVLRLMWQKFKQTLLNSLGGIEGVNRVLIRMGGWIVWASKILETKKGSWKNFADFAIHHVDRTVKAIDSVITFIEILVSSLSTMKKAFEFTVDFLAPTGMLPSPYQQVGKDVEEAGKKANGLSGQIKQLGVNTAAADKAMADFIAQMKDGGVTTTDTTSVMGLTEQAIKDLNRAAGSLTSGMSKAKEEIKQTGQAAASTAKDFESLEKRLNDALNFVSESDKTFALYEKRIEDAGIATKDFLKKLSDMSKAKTPLSEINNKFSDLRNEAAGIADQLNEADVKKWLSMLVQQTDLSVHEVRALNDEFERTFLSGPFQLNKESFLKQVDGIISEMENREKLKLQAEVRLEKVEGITTIINDIFNAIGSPGGLVTMLTEGLGKAVGSIFGGGAIGGAIGGMFGGIIGSIAELGKKSPEEVRAEFENFIKAFEKGIDMLEPLFEKIIPPFLSALFKGIARLLYTFALLMTRLFVQGLGNMFKGIINFFNNPWEKIKAWFSAIFDAIKETVKGFFQDIADVFSFRSGGRIPSGRQGLRMTQGTGMALLHPNEYVVPQSGMKPQAVERTLDQINAGQQGTTININSVVTERNAIDELVRMIERRYQSFGTSKSTLFAS